MGCHEWDRILDELKPWLARPTLAPASEAFLMRILHCWRLWIMDAVEQS